MLWKYLAGAIQNAHDRIDSTVVIEIAECRTPMSRRLLKIGSARGTDVLKPALADIAKDRVRLFERGPQTVPPRLSSTFPRATNRSFQPSLSKSKMPFDQPDIVPRGMAEPSGVGDLPEIVSRGRVLKEWKRFVLR